MIPGRVVGISVEHQLQISTYGLRNQDLNMEEETSFDIGSVTKVLATTAILMKLVEKRLISLDDEVAKFLDYWMINKNSVVTIKHLLQHRAGLNEWAPLYLKYSDKEEALQHIALEEMKYPIDQARRYSDLGFMTLGAIIEAIYGKQIDEVFKNEIAIPLGLNSTQFSKPVNMENVAATSLGDRFEREMITNNAPYKVEFKVPVGFPWRTKRLQGEVNDGNSYRVFTGISGHAGLFSTVSDMARFGESLIYENSLFSTMTINKFLETSQDPIQLSGFRTWKSGAYYGHTGFPGVALAINPNLKRVVALATNRLITDETPTPTEQLLEKYLVDE